MRNTKPSLSTHVDQLNQNKEKRRSRSGAIHQSPISYLTDWSVVEKSNESCTRTETCHFSGTYYTTQATDEPMD